MLEFIIKYSHVTIMTTMEPDIIIVQHGDNSPEEIEKTTLMSQLFFALRTPNKYDDIEVRKVDGKVAGVFANKYIEKGTVVTRFPAHYFCVFKPDNKFDSYPSNVVKNNGFEFIDDCHGYTFMINEKYGISGDPRINDDTRFAGHLIRDKLQIFSPENCEYDADQERVHNEHAVTQNSAIKFDDNNPKNGVFVESTRGINAGEELFIHNDYEYAREYSKAFHKKK